MKVLFATSEIAPWVKTGGLGDVAAALPPALRRAGCDVRVLVPRYPALRDAFPDAEHLVHLPWMGGHLPGADLYVAQPEGSFPFLLLDCPMLYDRSGNPYLGPEGRTGSTTTCASACCRASPRALPVPRRRSTGSRTSCIATTGRPASRPTTCATMNMAERAGRPR